MRSMSFWALAVGGLSVIMGCEASPSLDLLDSGSGIEPEGDAGTTGEAAYPEGPYGYEVGSVINNYQFQGYRLPLADSSQERQIETISLSDFYDPTNERYKLLHLSAGALWCDPCNREADQLAKISAAELGRGVVTVQALIEHDKAQPSSVATLDTWIARHQIDDFSVVLDPLAKSLGRFFPSGSIPWNAYVDVRTMKLVYSNVGYTGSIGTEDSRWLEYVDSHPPQ